MATKCFISFGFLDDQLNRNMIAFQYLPVVAGRYSKVSRPEFIKNVRINKIIEALKTPETDS
ncbi:hypothetical protein BZG01_07190 [Labilibaculum manganireducens]|uniref:Uncharacterized protein n=1 Tax=Labilibaculum manganireducens TaxID=1940525 RepID=A0A2N3IAY5_9BACT|nr:hypothetical protein BZG01_07190 [Labilibaculum manganireducens]